jgi:peptidoglycan/LPS O-acetylase OafA/YrhL
MPLGLAVMFWGDLQRRAGESLDAAKWANRATLALSLLLVPICKLAYDDPASDESWVRYVITYLAGLWAFALWSRRPSWTDASSAFLGRISYSMYLIHPVTMGLDLYVHQWMNPWVTTGIVVAITVLVSWGTYLLVEQPAIALGVRMRQRLGC